MENFDSVFNDDELNKILQESGRALRKGNINNFATKEIGDRVRIINYSSISHTNCEELLPEEYDKFIPDDYFIVIDTRQKKEKINMFGAYRQDLLIVNPRTKETFRIASRHVRIKETN